MPFLVTRISPSGRKGRGDRGTGTSGLGGDVPRLAFELQCKRGKKKKGDVTNGFMEEG